MKNIFARLSFMLVLALIFALVLAGTALADVALNIPLHNNVAEVGSDCPDDGGAYWHFVIDPNNDTSAFIVFHLNLGDANTYDTTLIIQNGDQWDNVFVAVPSGKDLQSLITEGSSADIIWQEVGRTPDSFQLSHVCPGEEKPEDLTVSKTAEPSYTRTFDWQITKTSDFDQIKTAASATFTYFVSVTKDFGTDSDFVVSGDITVSNPNDFDVAGVDVTDGACNVENGSDLVVPANGSITVSYNCSFDANPGSGINVAEVRWDDFGSENTSAYASAGYTFGDPTTLIHDCADVSDPLDAQSPRTFCGSGSFSYEAVYSQDPAGTCTEHDNTATLVSDTLIIPVTKTVEVCVGADLTVEKTAAASFTRTYAWDISKDVDKTLVKQIGGSATFNYTVLAWQTGFVDSDWAVSGGITVTNPNDWEAITFDAVDDVPGGVCTITGGTGVELAAGASVTLPYACFFAAQPAYFTDLVNTATATWDKDVYYTPRASAAGDATFQFADPTTTVNKTITITDTYAGTLGTLTATDAAPFASATFTYARTVPVPTWNCVTYDNTATIVETGQSDSESVRVCGPAKTGALTMGFWQNKNGQGIIKSGASVAGVCKSGTWLRQFAPFQDLGATASCSAVATYVTNVIKAANASGATMNAMLKGQMLATALDVYFSDPALGGNKINALAPIGSVEVDLTMICKDMTCSAFENSSAAFGNASSLTVMEMLTYAASQSNTGGKMWYGNIKAMQELAKDAFDAINNQKVFLP